MMNWMYYDIFNHSITTSIYLFSKILRSYAEHTLGVNTLPVLVLHLYILVKALENVFNVHMCSDSYSQEYVKSSLLIYHA